MACHYFYWHFYNDKCSQLVRQKHKEFIDAISYNFGGRNTFTRDCTATLLRLSQLKRIKKPHWRTREALSLQFRKSVASCHQNAELRFPSAITARCQVCLFTRVRHHSLLQAAQNYWGDMDTAGKFNTSWDLIINRLNGKFVFKRVVKYQTDSGYFQKSINKATLSCRKADKIF